MQEPIYKKTILKKKNLTCWITAISSQTIFNILFKEQLSKFLMCAHRDECILVM